MPFSLIVQSAKPERVLFVLFVCVCVLVGDGRGHHIIEEGLQGSAGRLAESGVPASCVLVGDMAECSVLFFI
jgi:hypothetical protein